MNNTATQLADIYRVTPRTIFLWKSKNVDVNDPKSIALHILESGRPSLKTLESVIDVLTPNTNPEINDL